MKSLLNSSGAKIFTNFFRRECEEHDLEQYRYL